MMPMEKPVFFVSQTRELIYMALVLLDNGTYVSHMTRLINSPWETLARGKSTPQIIHTTECTGIMVYV